MTILARLRTIWLNRHYRTRYACPVSVGKEKCCCGTPGCYTGWSIPCGQTMPRWRWVLVGHCGQHQGRPS